MNADCTGHAGYGASSRVGKPSLVWDRLASGPSAGSAVRTAKARRRAAHSPFSTLHSPAQRAFTLIELVVVIGIIILLVGIAVPAVGPALVSNYRSQATHALNSMLVSAQTSALSNTTDVGLRIERAVELDEYGRMTNRANPKFLEHQQMRFVIFNRTGGLAQPAFQYIKDSKITALPSAIWFAPTNFMGDSTRSIPAYGPESFFTPTKGNNTLIDDANRGAVGYRPFDTFYLVFSPNGTLKTWPADGTPPMWYVDDTQRYLNDASPIIAHPQDSAPGVLMYERKKLENAPRDLAGLFEFLRSSGQALYINRFLGTTVESQ